MSHSSTDVTIQRVPRLPFIDTLRGVALIAMATYHFTWDLEFFHYLEAGTATHGWLKIYARGIASTFLFLVGFSLVLAHSNGIRWQSFIKRLGMVAGAALLISVGTYIALPDQWIFFGILHNIAVSSLIALAFLRLPPLITGLVAVLLLGGMIADNWVQPGVLSFPLFDSRWLAWIGFAEAIPRSNDYVPLFPWFSAVLFGVAAAGLCLRHGVFAYVERLQQKPNILTKAGRHSLLFYLLHQPILIACVYLASLVIPPPAPDLVSGYERDCRPSCEAQGNDAGLCERFCGCTARALGGQSLLQPLYRGEINLEGDERVNKIVQECSIQSR
ncbi:DUF1624 domain-containing protein [Rhizobium rhizoryzae]|uniref:DUF1624 domain-containing protein n=1 Tax=Rhizobium rhizoryzae TaxID=451876 RepID=UPI00289F4A22|nr:heparan-alpha-glucosaminide N-acetyltransferase [Rhizobium rhizoryzae]